MLQDACARLLYICPARANAHLFYGPNTHPIMYILDMPTRPLHKPPAQEVVAATGFFVDDIPDDIGECGIAAVTQEVFKDTTRAATPTIHSEIFRKQDLQIRFVAACRNEALDPVASVFVSYQCIEMAENQCGNLIHPFDRTFSYKREITRQPILCLVSSWKCWYALSIAHSNGKASRPAIRISAETTKFACSCLAM